MSSQGSEISKSERGGEEPLEAVVKAYGSVDPWKGVGLDYVTVALLDVWCRWIRTTTRSRTSVVSQWREST
jgi:hypothetical protein